MFYINKIIVSEGFVAVEKSIAANKNKLTNPQKGWKIKKKKRKNEKKES